MAEFKPIETQEALDAIIKERVARAEAKYADYAELKSYKESHKGKDVNALEADIAKLNDQVKSLTEQLTEQTTKAKDASAKLTRMEVGQAAGLKPELIDRLRGDTRAELEADAKVLAGLTGHGGHQPGYKPSGDGGKGDPKDAAYATMLSSLIES